MDVVLIWIQGQSEQGCSNLRAGVYSGGLSALGTYPRRGQCNKDLIYCNLIKAMLILIMDLKLNKQVI